MGNYKPSGLKKIFKDILANNKIRKRKNSVKDNGFISHDTFGWENNHCDHETCQCKCNSCHCEDSCNSDSCNCKCSCDCQCNSCNND